jgi:Dinucleotide-utilizing enzymes involved in molybdopterin and thiamine biosynthesis family 2
MAGFSKEELARYNRHILIPNFGMKAQQKLKDAKVLVVGAGGLGSPLLLYLAAAGVGTIGIVDLTWWTKAISTARYCFGK